MSAPLGKDLQEAISKLVVGSAKSLAFAEGAAVALTVARGIVRGGVERSGPDTAAVLLLLDEALAATIAILARPTK